MTAAAFASTNPRHRTGTLALPLLAGLLIIVLLCLPDQLQEIYRIHADAWESKSWQVVQPLCALLALVGFSIFLWRIARELVGRAEPRLLSEGVERWWSHAALIWVPRIVVVLPLMGAALGLWLSARVAPAGVEIPPVFESMVPRLHHLSQLLQRASVFCGLLALALFLVATGFEIYAGRKPGHDQIRFRLLDAWPAYVGLLLAMAAAAVLLGGSIFVHVGVIPLIVLWSIAIVGLLANLWRVNTSLRWLMIAVLSLGLIGLDRLGWNDNHAFRQLRATQERPPVGEAFDRWLSARKDIGAYSDAKMPYPIYVVAAEGGGLYAAYRVGKFLARMQDVCPNFAQHVFAISSVSGGSLGAAMFSMLASEGAKNQEYVPCQPLASSGGFEAQMDRLLTRDFLSPVVSATLFPDFAQRLIPYPIPRFDRARALEASFEGAWGDVVGGANNRFAGSFLDSCGPKASSCLEGATPALVLNLTQVDTGMQLALSQLNFAEAGHPWSDSGRIYDVFAAGAGAVDLPLSTAVGLSARFPWITPSGWYQVGDAQSGSVVRTYRFADGGYSEGSGAGTAYKLAQLLADRIKKKTVPTNAVVHLIMLSATSPPLERFWMDAGSARGYGELELPLVALGSARRGQAYTTVFDIATASTAGLKISQGLVYDALVPLAIGWHLSQLTRDYIDIYSGDPKRCQGLKPNVASHWDLAASYVDAADCLAKTLIVELSPK